MLIFWKRHLVFLANTKTGSTSIEMALESLADVAVQRPPALKHTTAARFSGLLAPFLGESAEGQPFETVALIREPLDWLGSWYRYRLREHLPIGGDGSFAAFIAGYLDEPQEEFARVGSQAAFLTGADGQIAVDHLFRYEDIEQLLEFLEDRLDCAITLPHLNVSPRAPMDLPADLTRRLTERLAADYALYEAVGRPNARHRGASEARG
ncbi:hypothetical protein GVY41_03255 [Frigidibacter albus]|uniref:Gamma-glutamyl kinase n=1 Tax=Frigidibacter albus TaxID=1465486 RepID=A0A6L8VDB6_9RHOB|nr:hypothetical protein [Frigidibacter albus]MZQ88305.1 hypothetical protein [Frigidibacter albus]NBE30021.1 hypothetical protein [Frigidibacter albus]